KRDAHWQKAGYIPTDVAQCRLSLRERTPFRGAKGDRRLSLRERTPCYFAVWVRAGKGEQGVLLVGLSAQEHRARIDELKKKGFVPQTVQGLTAGDGTVLYSGVCWQGPGQPEQATPIPASTEPEHAGAVFAENQLLVDVDVGPS